MGDRSRLKFVMKVSLEIFPCPTFERKIEVRLDFNGFLNRSFVVCEGNFPNVSLSQIVI